MVIDSVFDSPSSLAYILFTTSFVCNAVYYTSPSATNIVHRMVHYACGVTFNFSCFVQDFQVFSRDLLQKLNLHSLVDVPRDGIFKMEGLGAWALGSLVRFSFLVRNWSILSCVFPCTTVSPVIVVDDSAVTSFVWLGLSVSSLCTGYSFYQIFYDFRSSESYH